MESTEGVFMTSKEWHEIDTAVRIVKKSTCSIFDTLVEAGCGITDTDSIKDAVYTIDGEVYPLPYIHRDFSIDFPTLKKSREDKQNIDTTTVQTIAFMVIQAVEKLFLGLWEVSDFGDMSLYGMCNHPNRITCPIAPPYLEGGSKLNLTWSISHFEKELKACVARLLEAGFTGPFLCILSEDWKRAGVNPQQVTSSLVKKTLISELLPEGTVVLVEMRPETILAFCGLDLTTIQWSSQAGHDVESPREIVFKVLACMLPLIRADHCGILHASAVL